MQCACVVLLCLALSLLAVKVKVQVRPSFVVCCCSACCFWLKRVQFCSTECRLLWPLFWLLAHIILHDALLG
jgi:hypothetical protein